jgi:hypothetical protein
MMVPIVHLNRVFYVDDLSGEWWDEMVHTGVVWPGWYYQISMDEPVGPFASQAKADDALLRNLDPIGLALSHRGGS